MNSHRPVRVLLIAEACNPEWTSVPLVGFNWYNALRPIADVTLVTQVRNRPSLLRHVADPARICFIDSEPLAAPLCRIGEILTLGRDLGWTTQKALMWLPYLFFEHLVHKQFQRALRQGAFDIIHRITPLSPVYASPIASWTNVPFVLGPLNGGLPWPRGTLRTRLAEMEWLCGIRGVYRLLPFVHRTRERAACILAGSRHTLSELPYRARRRAVYMPENGIDDRFCVEADDQRPRAGPLDLVFAGRLAPLKGVDILLHALARTPAARETSLTIIGDGPSRAAWQELAGKLGLSDRVRWTGWISQAQLASTLRQSSIFVFPSIKEFGGAVVMEAMASGLPCIVADYGGPGEYVSSATGIRVSIGSKTDMIRDFSRALQCLVSDPDRVRRMGQAARRYALSTYRWQVKAQRLLEVYEWVLGRRQGKPRWEEEPAQR